MKEEINKRFDDRFKNHESCNNENCLCKRYDSIKAFLHQEIERALAEREQEIVEVLAEATNNTREAIQAVDEYLYKFRSSAINEAIAQIDDILNN